MGFSKILFAVSHFQLSSLALGPLLDDTSIQLLFVCFVQYWFKRRREECSSVGICECIGAHRRVHDPQTFSVLVTNAINTNDAHFSTHSHGLCIVFQSTVDVSSEWLYNSAIWCVCFGILVKRTKTHIVSRTFSNKWSVFFFILIWIILPTYPPQITSRKGRTTDEKIKLIECH